MAFALGTAGVGAGIAGALGTARRAGVGGTAAGAEYIGALEPVAFTFASLFKNGAASACER
jgi:hypothetical protein